MIPRADGGLLPCGSFAIGGIASKASWGYDAGTMRISPKKRETAETAASLIVFYTAINDGSTIYSTLVTPGVGML